MKFWAVKKPDGSLVPADEVSAALFEGVPVEKPVEVEVRQPRNTQFHRMVFVLFGTLARAFDEDANTVRHKLSIAIGEYHGVVFPDGRIDRVPNSISYAAMDEIRFKEYFERLARAIYVIYGILPETIRKEIDRILAPDADRI